MRAAIPDLPADNIIAEPVARNTAPAVGLGAVVAERRRAGPDAVIAVLPGRSVHRRRGDLRSAGARRARRGARDDRHHRRPPDARRDRLRLHPARARACRAPAPTRSTTSAASSRSPTARPPSATSPRASTSGTRGCSSSPRGACWRRRAATCPALGALLDAAVAAKDPTPRPRRSPPATRGVPSISIDNGIMEKATGLRVVPGAFGWNDVGSWAALPAVRAPDARGNVVLGGATLIDGDGSIVVAEEGAPFVGVVGVRDLVVVATRDARAGHPQGPCPGRAPDRRGAPSRPAATICCNVRAPCDEPQSLSRVRHPRRRRERLPRRLRGRSRPRDRRLLRRRRAPAA